MEKFMFLFRGSEAYQANQSPEALQALKHKMMEWLGGLSEKGAYVSSQQLLREGRQVVGREKTLTDGPFGVDEAILGGSTIVLAHDMDEAVAIAKSCPILESNANIEIRQMLNV
nr:YciI family protein [uncultured Mucilaginibacter sp.]